MSIQKNVAQQNAETKAAIEKVAFKFVDERDTSLAWLVELLESYSLSADKGVLVRYVMEHGQGGYDCGGLWLSSDSQFWVFSVVLSYEESKIIELEEFENVTSSIQVSAHLKGIGKSFGFLAVEVLHAMGNN